MNEQEVRVECPACGQGIECTAAAAVGKLNCPTCGRAFVVRRGRSKKVGWTGREQRTLEERATFTERASWVMFGLCALCLLGALLCSIQSEPLEKYVQSAGGFLCLGFMTNLIGQLLHIRAALDRK